ncbi:MAG: InlB B-repeat-containing protein [Ferruginibacter sp.]
MVKVKFVPYQTLKTSLYKNLLGFLFLLCITSVQAKTYYFSSTGSDTYSSTQAQSASTPWKSISKLNSYFSSLAAGDSVLFKRGETFYGSITPVVSGVIFSAYGTGSVKPVLTGLTAITSWTSAGTNLWKSSAISASKVPCILTVNGNTVAYGRYPNRGYNYFESHIGTVSIIDNELPALPLFTGGELVLRLNGYELNRHPITLQAATTITFSGNSKTIKDNYGYFIQNHLSTLDLQNEWCYDNTAKTVTIYSTTSPVNVKVSTLENIININGINSLTFKDLAFEGANNNAFSIKDASNIIIDGCEIRHSGVDAVAAVSVTNSLFQNCKVYNSYNNAFDLDDAGNSSIIVRSNTINKSGAVPGMGMSGSGSVMHGVAIAGNGHTVEYNTIDSSGSSGIIFKKGNNQTLKNNVINTYCFVKHDGGGIYTWNNDMQPTTYTNNKIIGNIILNGIGAGEGTPNVNNLDVDGIMMDDNAGNVTITDNTVANIPGKGMYIHNSFNMTVLRNTLFNNGSSQIDFTHNLAYINGTLSPYTTPLRNVTFKNNILCSKTADQNVMNIYSIRNDLDSMGTSDSNYYARPIYDDWTITATRSISGTSTNSSYNVASWKTSFKRDQASKKTARNIAAYTINSLTGSNLITYGQFVSDISGLRAYSSNNNQTVSWDNTSKISGTGSLKLVFNTVVSNVYSLLYSSIGAVSNEKNYILRFTTIGSTDTGMLRVYLRLTNSPYSSLTPVQMKSFGKTKTTHEFLFASPAEAADAVYAIEVKQSSGTTYIDNIELYEANVSITEPDDNILFEYNPTNVVKTIALDGNYIGVDSVLYSNSLTLQPYSSKILIKDTARRSVNNMAVSLSKSAVGCFGGNATVTIAATGGTAPYTGTGSYTVNAGRGTFKLSFPTSTTKYSFLTAAVGTVTATKTYAFRFTTLGSTDTGAMRCYLRQTASPYANMTALQTKSFGKTRTDHEFIFTAATSEAATFVIEVKQTSGTTYIDNIEFYELGSGGVLVGSNLFTNGLFTSNISGLTVWSENSNQAAAWDSTSKITNNYTYIIKDAAGASIDTTITVTQPAAPLAVTAVAGTISVYGGTTTVTVSATGGTAPYTNTGSFTVRAGTYTYTVTDANGCYSSAVVTVTQPAATLTASVLGNTINCFGESASVVVNASGGTAPYTGTGSYEIEAGVGSLKLSFTSPVAGSYTKIYANVGALTAGKNYLLKFTTLGTAAGNLRAGIRMTNSPWTNLTTLQTATFGTTRTEHQFIFTGVAAQSAASYLIEVDQASGTTYFDNIVFFECTSTGTIIGSNTYTNSQFLSDVSGVAGYSATNNHTIAWDNTSKINDTYYFTVKDAIGSTNTVSVVATQPAAKLAATATAGTITVAGGTTSVTVAATGGTAPYSGAGTFTNVAAGTYNYTVTDANGCTTTAPVTITQPSSAYTLTTTATPTAGGTITRNPNTTSYTAGTIVTLTAAPAAGYVFTGWSGDVTGTSSSVSVTMNSNKTVTANFQAVTYTLTTVATPTAGGTVAKSPSTTSYAQGAVVTLTATPTSGYVFTGWSGDATGTATMVTVTMNSSKTVTANFQAATYTLTTTATPTAGGTIAKSPSATSYAAGTVVTLTATAASGYIFTGWSGDVTATTTSVTVTMSSNKSVTANFAPAYTLTTTATPTAGGTVAKSPSATTYASGTVVTLTATAASGYVFTGWSGDVTGTATSVSVTMSSNKSVTANFAPAYTLTTTVTPNTGGTITRSPNAASYRSGTVVTLTATAASGYVFTGWSGDVTGTSASITVTMNSNKSVTANFQAITYTLTTTVTPTAGGSVSKSPSATSYSFGTVVTLTATAASGYIFTGWSGDVTGTATSVTVTMSSNMSVTANFAPAYTLTTTATPTAGGSVSKSPSATTYASGTAVTLTATPAAGYVFTGWSGDATGTATSVTVTMNSNKNVTANFQSAAYTLTTSSTPSAGGTIAKSPSATSYAAGTVVTVTVTPAAGYVFTGWSGAASGTATSASITMSTNKTVIANFAVAYALTTTASPSTGGTITRSPNATSYATGSTVSLTATPAAGYVFTGWSNGATGTTNPVTVTMNAAKTVTANFAPVYTLTTTATPADGGTIAASPAAASYTSGTVVTLTATAASGYTFTGWSGDATGTTTSVTVTMNSNKNVTANFQASNTTVRIEDDVIGTAGLCSFEGTTSANSGATNGRSLNLTNSALKGINWRINAGATGTYNLNWRYANGSTSNSFVMRLIINGVTVNDAVPFPKTTGSSSFVTTNINVTLTAGTNEIRLESVANSATADVDWMEVTGFNPSAATCAAARTAAAATTTDESASSTTSRTALQNTSVVKAGVYPNPTSGAVNIKFNVAAAGKINIGLYSADGRLLKDFGTNTFVEGSQVIQQNLASLKLKPGLYNIVVRNAKAESQVFKVVIQN